MPEAVTVDRARKTKENKKRMNENANTSQKLFRFKERRKEEGPYLQIQESNKRGANSAKEANCQKSSNPSVSQVSETSKKDFEDLFHNFYDEYFDASKIMKSTTMNVETSNVEIPSHEEEVFHESSESFQEESSSSSLNDDVQQSSEEVKVSSSNT
nr:hypothetical protein [Tanacetum cinerariifolium]